VRKQGKGGGGLLIYGAALSPDNPILYGGNRQDNTLAGVNTESYQVIGTVEGAASHAELSCLPRMAAERPCRTTLSARPSLTRPPARVSDMCSRTCMRRVYDSQPLQEYGSTTIERNSVRGMTFSPCRGFVVQLREETRLEIGQLGGGVGHVVPGQSMQS
jgi:hypothetical protein